MKLTFWITVLIFLSIATVGQYLFEADVQQDTLKNPYNLSETVFGTIQKNISQSMQPKEINFSKNATIQYVMGQRALNILFKTMDYGIYSVTEFGKIALEFGYTKGQEYGVAFWFKVIKWMIFIFIILMVLRAWQGFVLLGMLFYVIHIGIKKLISKCRRKRKNANN